MAIVHMKKLRLMVVRRQKDELLRDLMLLGCVQISEPDALLADAESAAVLRQESGNVTEVRSELTRLTAALKLLDKYANDPELQVKGKLLPVPSNQKMNSHLKEIAAICNIGKNLTTHVARHTFACLAIEYGMPIDIIAKILGHTNVNMTRHYAKVSEANISREMQKIGSILNR